MILKGSLLEHHSDMSNSTISIIGNSVRLNKIIGNYGSLFGLFGGIAIISENILAFNGILELGLEIQVGNPDSIQLLADGITPLPYSQYSFRREQTFGVFSFWYFSADIEVGTSHYITNNTFQNIACS